MVASSEQGLDEVNQIAAAIIECHSGDAGGVSKVGGPASRGTTGTIAAIAAISPVSDPTNHSPEARKRATGYTMASAWGPNTHLVRRPI
jgi:hypothetical protein